MEPIKKLLEVIDQEDIRNIRKTVDTVTLGQSSWVTTGYRIRKNGSVIDIKHQEKHGMGSCDHYCIIFSDKKGHSVHGHPGCNQQMIIKSMYDLISKKKEEHNNLEYEHMPQELIRQRIQAWG